MAYKDDLETARDQIAARIVEVTASANPDYSVGNRSISKGAYLAQLMDSLAKLEDAILRADQTTNGPFEIRTYHPI